MTDWLRPEPSVRAADWPAACESRFKVGGRCKPPRRGPRRRSDGGCLITDQRGLQRTTARPMIGTDRPIGRKLAVPELNEAAK